MDFSFVGDLFVNPHAGVLMLIGAWVAGSVAGAIAVALTAAYSRS